MKRTTEDMIWAYLDGTSSAEERQQIDQLLTTDQAFREEFKKSELLHRQLQDMEAEMPSLRFAQNVMDRLPAVKDLATSPLVSVKWMRSFGFTFMSLLLVFWGGSTLLVPGNVAFARDTNEMVRLLEWIAQLTAKGTSGPLLFLGIVFISMLCLLFLDRWLQARFTRIRPR
jgi:anti-sigma factor RsiW